MKTAAARQRRGTLACVGIGITLGSHLTPLARSHIEKADVVFVAASDALVERWIAQMNADVRSLQPLYSEGKPRARTYREMVAVMLDEVRAGRNVCAAFYGHPGVFAWSTHRAIAVARREGHRAWMEPGVSAADCLYADLGIDPGMHGCQHLEASQLLLCRRRIDPCGYLVVWQAGVVGDRGRARAASTAAARQLLVDALARSYPLDHRVVIYRAATLPVEAPRVVRTRLRNLARHALEADDTLVLAPAQAAAPDRRMAARLEALARAGTR